MKPTSVTAQDLDVIIEKGAKAPFYGVLVPETNYYLYQSKVKEADRLTSYLMTPVETYRPETEWNKVFLFVGGALVGAFTVKALGK